jgi:hypothetical protein
MPSSLVNGISAMTKLVAEAGRIPQAGIDIAEVATMAAVVEPAVTDVVGQRPPGGAGTRARRFSNTHSQQRRKIAVPSGVPYRSILKKIAGPNPTPHHASLPI